MKLLNKVKDELQQNKGYDFGSEFWTDEMLRVAYDLVYTTEKVLNEKVEAPKKESATKFIQLPGYVQEMISLQTCTLIQNIKVKAIQRIKDEGVKDTTEFILSCLTVEVMEQKATAYFREMELIEQITELRKEVEDGIK